MVNSRVESELIMVSNGLIAGKVPCGKLPWLRDPALAGLSS